MHCGWVSAQSHAYLPVCTQVAMEIYKPRDEFYNITNILEILNTMNTYCRENFAVGMFAIAVATDTVLLYALVFDFITTIYVAMS